MDDKTELEGLKELFAELDDVRVDFEIVIDIYDRMIRFEDSIYGGVTCYPRIIEREMAYPCLDCRRADYNVSFYIRSNCTIITSGKVSYGNNKMDTNLYHISNSLGFSLLISNEIDCVCDRVSQVELIIFFFKHEGTEFDINIAKEVLKLAKKCIIQLIRIMDFFPYKTLYIVPGNKFYQGGYVSNKIIYSNFAHRF